MTIKRPSVEYNDAKHEYKLNGVKLDGVSTVSKVGDTDVWGVASAWAWRLGYEGAYDIADRDSGPFEMPFGSKDELREALKQARKTPWHKTDDAKERGNAIHDALEHLAQKREVPILDQYPEAFRGYVQGLCRWWLDFRPTFLATEVQVVSETHSFAGRFDLIVEIEVEGKKIRVLVDLKTGRRIYPTSQFSQLAGYQLAAEEMGYRPFDGGYVLNVKDDGTYDFERSNAGPEHFLSYLAAHRSVVDLKQKNKKGKA